MTSYYGLIPAAGSGSRMGYDLPKQYLKAGGQPLIYYAIRRLCASPTIKRVIVVLAPEDRYFAQHEWGLFAAKLRVLPCGGATRSASVLNGLVAARDEIGTADWVLVHDAARPCLAEADLARLIAEVGEDEAGGLLAVPVADTLKRADEAERVIRTEPRDGLWQAQTPQMFRYQLLVDALQQCDPVAATDESRAVEHLGFRPRLVRGSARNFKVTYPEDLRLANQILQAFDAANGGGM